MTKRNTRPYYTLLEYRDGFWCIEFGDYDRSVVKQELDDHCDGSGQKRKNMMIIETPNALQATIDARVIEENRKQAEKTSMSYHHFTFGD